MTVAELEELLNDSPTLFHMAELGSWPSIRSRGLLSTTALLDLYEVAGEARTRIEERRRLASIELSRPGLPTVVVRDQIPMDDKGLLRSLPPDMSPAAWYRILNSKVFFWLTKERLLRLISAGAYRDKLHDVIEVDSRRLVGAYFGSVWLCPMNSGCTKPFPHPRDKNTFARIVDYPYADWRRKRKRGERAVELAVDYAVPDLAQFVRRVTAMKGGIEFNQIYP